MAYGKGRRRSTWASVRVGGWMAGALASHCLCFLYETGINVSPPRPRIEEEVLGCEEKRQRDGSHQGEWVLDQAGRCDLRCESWGP